jgi:hypothetical protein
MALLLNLVGFRIVVKQNPAGLFEREVTEGKVPSFLSSEIDARRFSRLLALTADDDRLVRVADDENE